MGLPSVMAERIAAALLAGAGTPSPGAVRVHIDVDPPRQVTLYEESVEPDARALAGARTRRSVTAICDAPCDRVIDVGPGRYVSVGGPGVTRSSPFLLGSSDPEVRLEVRPGIKALSIIGWIAIGIGSAALIGGATTMTFADNDNRRLTIGGIVLGSSLPVLVGGGLMTARGRTKIRNAGG